MNRRQFLVRTTMIVPIGLVGCLGRESHPYLPDGMTVETHHRVGSHLTEDRVGTSGGTYETVITDQTTAQDRMKDEGEIEKFIQETDFDQSYFIVVVAAAWSSSKWLELAEIERTDDGLQIAIIVASPDGDVASDAAVHSMAIRITDKQRDAPGNVDSVVGE